MASMIFTRTLKTQDDVHHHLARTLLVLSGRSYHFDDYQGLGHAEPYGEAEAAWDSAGELIGEALTERDADTMAEVEGLTAPVLYREALALEMDRIERAGKRQSERIEDLEAELATLKAARDHNRKAWRKGRDYSRASELG